MTTTFDAPLEVKFVAETGVFEGYASVFDITDNVGDIIVPGAFKKALARWRTEGRFPPLLWQHDTTQPIGVWQDMYEDTHGLYVKGALLIDDIPRAREAWRLLKENVVTGLSIGYRTKESYRDKKSGARVLAEVDLLEVSVVTFPANELARVTRMKTLLEDGRMPSAREFETFLRGAGFSRRQAKRLTAEGHKALSESEDQQAVAAFITLAHDMADYMDECNRRLTRLEKKYGIKYDPNQPRHPAGSSRGGEWSGPLPQRKPSREHIAKPSKKPGRSDVTKPVQKPYREPVLDQPDWFVDGHVNSTWSPLDLIGLPAQPAAGAVAARATTTRNAVRLRGYLKEARHIPKGVREVGKGAKKLSYEQQKSLKRFKGKGKHFKNPAIINYSDKSVIYSSKVPAKNIPDSYALYEKHINTAGQVIRTNKITIGPDGELIHIIPK